MATSFRPLHIRKVLVRCYGMDWSRPKEYGEDGWSFVRSDHERSLIVSRADDADSGIEWVHASVAGNSQERAETPTYHELTWLHEAVFGEGYAYQVFAPSDQHVNIHAHALHLWGRLDGKPVLPEFGRYGTI